MTTILTDIGWTGLSNGVWTDASDTVTDNVGGIQLVAGFPAWVNLSESSCLRGLLSFLTKIAQVSLVLIVDRRKDGSISTVAMDSHAFDLRTV